MKKLFLVMATLSAAVFWFAGRQLAGIYQGYQAGTESYTALAEQGAAIEEAPVGGEQTAFRVDVQRLRETYPEVIGWLYAPGTSISYPIVQGRDNEYYLHHLYNGEENHMGTPFADGRCPRPFRDAHTIVYGHNMKNGTMFAPLLQYRQQDFYEAHPEMTLFTPEGDYRLVLFSGYTTTADADTYTLFETAGPELQSYLTACRERSDFAAPLPEKADKILTLSTCTNADPLGRYVVQGVLTPAK